MKPEDRIIIALDLHSLDQARDMVDRLGSQGRFYKIGYQLAYGDGGLAFTRELVDHGKKVFVDLKLLDIDNTVAHGIQAIADMGVHMTTVHAYPNTMRAAVKAAKGTPLCVLGVTVLTSMDNDDLKQAGYEKDAATLVSMRAQQAAEIGMGGLVASAQEASTIRNIVGEEMAVVTPGIRPAGSNAGDQKRIMTPTDAIAAGSSHLVIGRPIVAAPDPKQALQQIIHELNHLTEEH